MLPIIHRLIEVGTKFCTSLSPTYLSTSSSSLQESLKKQCWAYFYSYHCDRLEDLKMHLENEVSLILNWKWWIILMIPQIGITDNVINFQTFRDGQFVQWDPLSIFSNCRNSAMLKVEINKATLFSNLMLEITNVIMWNYNVL